MNESGKSRYTKPVVSGGVLLLLLGLLITATGNSNSSNPMKMLFQFDEASPAQPWAATNDGVMGGLSEGSARLSDNGMLFTGDLSLENNGGFSSIRQRVNMDLSEYQGIRVKVRGDGRTYQLRLESDARFRDRWAVSFSGDIETVAGEWVEVNVPFDALSQSWRGRQFSEYTFNPSAVQMIGVILADKQPGDFEVEIAWVAAYR
ncbi:MAG: CIA30 family protein [Verrucomicrobiota bacterium]